VGYAGIFTALAFTALVARTIWEPMMPFLSPKEVAIIEGLADGLQSKEIAAVVRLSKASVDTYIRILYGKLGARSRAQLVALAYAAGMLARPDAGSPGHAFARAQAASLDRP
jgi:DNA-binding NarL/FixJ family response regulator